MQEFDIRYSEMKDAFTLSKWLEEEKNMHWLPISDAREKDFFIKNWIYYFRKGASLTATVDDKVCGIATLFLMYYKKVSHHCIFYMVMSDEYKGREVEKSLLKNILNSAKNYFHLEMIHIEKVLRCVSRIGYM